MLGTIDAWLMSRLSHLLSDLLTQRPSIILKIVGFKVETQSWSMTQIHANPTP